MGLRRILTIGTIVAVLGLEAILAACGGKEAVTPGSNYAPPAQAEVAAPSEAIQPGQYDLTVKGDDFTVSAPGTVTLHFGAELPETLILASSDQKYNQPALDTGGNVAYYVNDKKPLRGAVEAVPLNAIKRILGPEFSPQTLEEHLSQHNLRPLTKAEMIMTSAYFLPLTGDPVNVDTSCLFQRVNSYNGMVGVNVYPRLNGAELNGFVVATDTVGGGYSRMNQDVRSLARSCQTSPPQPMEAPSPLTL